MVKFRYSVHHRLFIYASYVRTESARAVRRLFQQEYPDVQVPNRSTIHQLVNKFRETGSVLDRKHKRQRTVLTEETLDNIRHVLEKSPRISIRRLSQQIGLSYGSAQTAMKLLKLQSEMPAQRREAIPASPRLIYEMEPDQHMSSAVEEITIKVEPEMVLDQHRSSAVEEITVKVEPEMVLDQHMGSAIEGITIKQEPVENEVPLSPMPEFDYISVKEEPPEYSPPEVYFGPSTSNIDESENEKDEQEAVREDNDEVCSPPEVYLGPITSNIDETENEKDEEEVMREDNEEDIKQELCSTHDDSEAESTILAGVD